VTSCCIADKNTLKIKMGDRICYEEEEYGDGEGCRRVRAGWTYYEVMY
jgi:hypothetical protein